MTKKYKIKPKETVRQVNVVKVPEKQYLEYVQLKKVYCGGRRIGEQRIAYNDLLEAYIKLFYPGLRDPNKYPFIFPPSVRTVYLGDNIDGSAGSSTRMEDEKPFIRSRDEGMVEVRHPILAESH